MLTTKERILDAAESLMLEKSFHSVGLNEEFLVDFLENSGFSNIQKVDQFGFFEDTSTMLFRGVPISLNVVAEKPLTPNITATSA